VKKFSVDMVWPPLMRVRRVGILPGVEGAGGARPYAAES